MSYMRNQNPRHNRETSFDDFKEMVSNHEFSYEMIGRCGIDSGIMEQFVRAQDYEARVIFPAAWQGGYKFMDLLAERAKKFADKQAEPTRQLKLLIKLGEQQGPEFMEYLNDLVYHDWTYNYSDDVKVWRRGADIQKGLEKLAAKGGIWEQAFDMAKSMNT